MPPFDWHSDRITRATLITASYRNTQNMQRVAMWSSKKRWSGDSRPEAEWLQ